ncbi:MAG: DUF309 domain-containing protein [Candidatus Caenarcaniphilales bacterium]|jgi:predicted metal-dependent hydrolase|nr:DUF309 domain-containing protein [Candidatus Caenarcaniphilales bacterium]
MDKNKKEFFELFDSGNFYDAHEFLEQHWNQEQDPEEKKYLQALIQIAVARHLLEQKRYVGAQKVIDRAIKNLEGIYGKHKEIDIKSLVQFICNECSKNQ